MLSHSLGTTLSRKGSAGLRVHVSLDTVGFACTSMFAYVVLTRGALPCEWS